MYHLNVYLCIVLIKPVCGAEGWRGEAYGTEGTAESMAETQARPGESQTSRGAHPQERETQEGGGEAEFLKSCSCFFMILHCCIKKTKNKHTLFCTFVAQGSAVSLGDAADAIPGIVEEYAGTAARTRHKQFLHCACATE